jgi:L-seryl-tRNA(Ser) seleniumtransferase
VPLVMDLGSGLMIRLDEYGLHGEPTVSDAVRDGASLVVVSGDKLLGGPQAGILVGTRQAVDACRRNPLTRALRVDKLTLAALEATLSLYRDPEVAVREVPALAMVTAAAEAVHTRALRIAMSLQNAGIACEVVESEGAVGGGAFPTARLKSSAVAIQGHAGDTERKLRSAREPVIGRIVNERVLLDPRSVAASHDEAFANAVIHALTE